MKLVIASIKSESGDSYLEVFKINRIPDNQKEWKKALMTFFEGWDEVDYMYVEDWVEVPVNGEIPSIHI